MKHCEKCGENKDIADFHYTMFSADGRATFCRDCCKGHMLSRMACEAHRKQAARRGIEFNLTYEAWFNWWHDALARKGPGAERGKGLGQWRMCRFNDRGPYELGNIFCGSAKENGADSRQAKACQTPDGLFPSIKSAARHYGIHPATARYRASRSMSGWRYADRA